MPLLLTCLLLADAASKLLTRFEKEERLFKAVHNCQDANV